MITLQNNRFTGINCLNSIMRAFEGAEVDGKPVEPPSYFHEGYIWKRKPPHKVIYHII